MIQRRMGRRPVEHPLARGASYRDPLAEFSISDKFSVLLTVLLLYASLVEHSRPQHASKHPKLKHRKNRKSVERIEKICSTKLADTLIGLLIGNSSTLAHLAECL